MQPPAVQWPWAWVDLEGLIDNRWTIGLLSTIGVLLSTAVVGVLTWLAFSLLGVRLDVFVCLTVGALTTAILLNTMGVASLWRSRRP